MLTNYSAQKRRTVTGWAPKGECAARHQRFAEWLRDYRPRDYGKWRVEKQEPSGRFIDARQRNQIRETQILGLWINTDPLSELESKLEPLYSLEDNWDSYGAPAPSQRVLAFARGILDWLTHPLYRPSGIVASAEGGIAFCFVKGAKYSHIEILNSGESSLVMYEGAGEPEIQELRQSFSEISRALESIREYLAD